jgi:hypothetical protein
MTTNSTPLVKTSSTPQSGTLRSTETYDLVVCGGGLAGLCCAIAAAREGVRVCLIQNRPVLGGNSSSEVRVTVHGAAAFHAYARETGILSEMLIEERARNHETINENGWVNSVWDLVMYDWAQKESLLTLHLNTEVVDLIYDGGERASATEASRPPATTEKGYGWRPPCAPSTGIFAVIARVSSSQREIEIRGTNFVDATGDSIIGDLAGCEWRWGSESREETGELHAPEKASTDVMGNSIHLRCREMGREVPFVAPDWAVKHEDPSYFYDQGRIPHDPAGGYWWIEIGVPYNTLYGNEEIRHELTRHALGVWDWMKNRDPKTMEKCKNYALDFIGQVPGKRENRRLMGQYLMTENDIQSTHKFEDEIAYGGWFVDLHTPGGLLAATSEPAAGEGYQVDSDYAAKSYVAPYGIPLRSLLSRDMENLSMAGRNVSVTHAALGTVRVMGTTALMGQALGIAAAVAHRNRLRITKISDHPHLIREIQQTLLREGCHLPHVKRQDPLDLAPLALVSASSSESLAGSLPASDQSMPFEGRLAQIIPTDGGKIESLSIFLQSGETRVVTMRLVKVPTIWSYRDEQTVFLAEAQVPVDPSGKALWNLHFKGTGSPGFLRLEVNADSIARWRHSTNEVHGSFALRSISKTRWRSLGGSLAYEISPSQSVFGPEQVIRGDSRPSSEVNCWISHSSQSLPQSLELRWKSPQLIREIQLVFPGHLRHELHRTPALFRDPQIPKDYQIEIFEKGSWREAASVEDNYQRLNRIQFKESVQTDRVRLMMTKTNGSPSAQICEVRVYS